jgi:drug/metabolite transporter (DMT)-like permease
MEDTLPMGLNIFLLYGLTVTIWGTTWLAIKFQLGTVDPMISVVYRFGAAAVLLLCYCSIRRLPMRFLFREHLYLGLQGALLFGLNYWLTYLAEVHLASGLVAVVFSTLVLWNIINGALLLRSPVRPFVVLAALIGLSGIGILFWPEITSFSLSDRVFYGLLLSVAATMSSSMGNIVSARNQKARLPVIQSNAYGMSYGAVAMGIVAVLSGKEFGFEVSFSYVVSLFYLAVFGSIIAFGSYLTLIGRIGADRAAYASMLFPVVALGISTVYEGYRWSMPGLAGAMLIITGNLIVLNRKSLAR